MGNENVVNRDTEEMKLWLFDIAHGNLDEHVAVKGFIKHYVLHGLSKDNLKDDILFRTTYGSEGAQTAMIFLEKALQKFVE